MVLGNVVLMNASINMAYVVVLSSWTAFVSLFLSLFVCLFVCGFREKCHLFLKKMVRR